LGLRFLDEVEEVIGRILKTPEKWRKIDADVRLCLMDNFPFTIFYRIRGTFLEILAVSHHGRRPGYWKPRLRVISTKTTLVPKENLPDIHFQFSCD
jgi:hypothetical protein